MKITLMPAGKRRKQPTVECTEKTDSMRRVVEKFINGNLKRDINLSTGFSVNTEVPSAAYDDLKLFYALCEEELTKLDYECGESHDGGGMYNTLWVSWKKLPADRD